MCQLVWNNIIDSELEPFIVFTISRPLLNNNDSIFLRCPVLLNISNTLSFSGHEDIFDTKICISIIGRHISIIDYGSADYG